MFQRQWRVKTIKNKQAQEEQIKQTTLRDWDSFIKKTKTKMEAAGDYQTLITIANIFQKLLDCYGLSIEQQCEVMLLQAKISFKLDNDNRVAVDICSELPKMLAEPKCNREKADEILQEAADFAEELKISESFRYERWRFGFASMPKTQFRMRQHLWQPSVENIQAEIFGDGKKSSEVVISASL